jgi:hypothetical protein
MALKDVLPDRPLTFEEFQHIQSQDTFDAVYTDETSGYDALALVRGDREDLIHYTPEQGWHRCGVRDRTTGEITDPQDSDSS